MKFTLSDSVKVGQKIKTVNGWRKIIKITETSAIVKDDIINFGDRIYGWKLK